MMDKKLFKSIGDVPNARESWRLIRNAVTSKLIGNDVFPIQHIQDGSYYKLGDVVLKEPRTLSHRILRNPPVAIRAGHLKGFLKPSKNERDDEAILSSFRYEFIEANFNPTYSFFKESTRKGIKKSICVEVEGCTEVCFKNIPKKNSLSVSFAETGLDFMPKFYLISTVYYAQKVRIVVQINDQMDEYVTNSSNWAIGFTLHRYHADDYGNIGAPARKSPKKMKIFIVPRNVFPGFPVNHTPPKRENNQSHDQESPPVHQSAGNRFRRHSV